MRSIVCVIVSFGWGKCTPEYFFLFVTVHWLHHAALILHQSKLNQPPTSSPLISFLPVHVQYCTPSSLFRSPLCFPVFQLQSLLTLISFVSSELSPHLAFFFSPASKNLLSSLSDFPRWFFRPTRFPFFFFSLSPSPVVHSPPLQPPLPPTETLLMDPMSAEYQSKPHNCTVALCLSLPQRLSLLFYVWKKEQKNCWLNITVKGLE